MFTPANLLAIFIGGGLGSLCRFGVSHWITAQFKTAFPLGTLTANVLSCLILAGILLMYREKLMISPLFFIMAVTGFCGGFSTFSTFSLENVELIKSGFTGYAIVNILLSVVLCTAVLFMLIKK